MTFRSRLLRSIIGVVCGTTAASLYIAHSQNSASYRAVVDEMFRREAATFQRQQQVSLTNASAQATKLAESVRLFAAMEADDESVYEVAKNEMRLGDFSFYRLANANGRLIPAPQDYDGLSPEANASLALQLPLPSELTKGSPTNIGFVALPNANSTPLYRVLVSPIVKTFDGVEYPMGWLVLAQHFEQAGDASGTMQSGIMLNGKLISPTLPAEVANALSNASTMAMASPNYRVASVVLNPGSILPAASLVTAFSLAEFHAQQRALAWRILAIGIAALLVAALIAWRASRRLAEPIRQMVAATQRVQRGEFDIQLPPDATHEIDMLARSLNDMAAGLALKERYRSVLHRVADAQVADELIHGNLPLGGEMRQVSTIFCDIRGYTSMISDMNPADVITLLNEHMSALTRIVHARRGVVQQFSGDSILILFGAPKSYASDASDAAHCAIEMMRERLRLNATAERPLHIGIGIASGEVLAGCLGSEHRAEYTVIGERVNLAARLCSSAAAGEILVDQATQSLWAKDTFEYQAVEPLTLKGYAQAMAAWRLVGEK